MSDTLPHDELSRQQERMPLLLERYQADHGSLERCFAVPGSPRWRERLRTFIAEWREISEALPFEEFSRSDQVDWLLFRHLLSREVRRLDREEERFREVQALLPFAADLIALEEERRRLGDIDAAAVAERLDRA